MLAPGPAAATQRMSRFGFRRLPKFTGTGLAQPKRMLLPAKWLRLRYHHGHKDGPHRIDVPKRIQADPPLCIGRHVAEVLRDVTVGSLVESDREYEGQCKDREGTNEVCIHRQASPNTARLPLPSRSTCGPSPVRSTIVVISTPHAPLSMTRST